MEAEGGREREGGKEGGRVIGREGVGVGRERDDRPLSEREREKREREERERRERESRPAVLEGHMSGHVFVAAHLCAKGRTAPPNRSAYVVIQQHTSA